MTTASNTNLTTETSAYNNPFLDDDVFERTSFPRLRLAVPSGHRRRCRAVAQALPRLRREGSGQVGHHVQAPAFRVGREREIDA
jgi:hypothetical protein